MKDKNTQVIPAAEAIVRFMDQDAETIFGSHSTFAISELLKLMEISSRNQTTLRDDLQNIVADLTQNAGDRRQIAGMISTLIEKDSTDETKQSPQEIILQALLSGINCNLLEPNGSGWQKGQLKIHFEFTLEAKHDSPESQTSSENTYHSALDEIRQLLIE
jgi:rhamnogalacturonyl hydrolase YesR